MSKTLKWVMIGAGIALGVIAIILCSIFITAGVSAGKHNISRAEAETIAKQCVSEYENGDINLSRVIVKDNDRDFHVGSKISNSYYTYDVELIVDGHEYEVEVNARTKAARLTDVDYKTVRQ